MMELCHEVQHNNVGEEGAVPSLQARRLIDFRPLDVGGIGISV